MKEANGEKYKEKVSISTKRTNRMKFHFIFTTKSNCASGDSFIYPKDFKTIALFLRMLDRKKKNKFQISTSDIYINVSLCLIHLHHLNSRNPFSSSSSFRCKHIICDFAEQRNVPLSNIVSFRFVSKIKYQKLAVLSTLMVVLVGCHWFIIFWLINYRIHKNISFK